MEFEEAYWRKQLGILTTTRGGAHTYSETWPRRSNAALRIPEDKLNLTPGALVRGGSRQDGEKDERKVRFPSRWRQTRTTYGCLRPDLREIEHPKSGSGSCNFRALND